MLNDLEESNQRALIAEREVEVLKEQLQNVRESSVERETSDAKEMVGKGARNSRDLTTHGTLYRTLICLN